MNRNNNFKTLDEKKKELVSLKTEWEKMKEQEKKLKEKFYSSPFEARAKIKRELTSLQEEIFEKRNCGTNVKFSVRDEEWLQRLKNPTGPATDPHHLASLIKKELRETLDGSRKFEAGDRTGDIWPASQDEEICYFGRNKEVNELIANLARNRQKPVDLDGMTTRLVGVKKSDFSAADFNEMISLVHQVQNFLEEQDKQDRQKTENIKLNNPHLFTQWKCSTDGKYNGRGGWENWHTFSGKHNGFNYTIYVPDNHIALTNCLFDNGWGTNSEVSKFFVVEGVAKPTDLHYWNVAEQRDEIISEAEARKLTKKDKDYYIGYKTYVDLNDKITIDHYRENGQELAKPVSGANQELSPSDNQKNMSGSLAVDKTENSQLPDKVDIEFLLKYFQEHDIKKMSLTSKGNLRIEYNNGRTEISGKTNNPKLQKITSYYLENGQESLSQQDLTSLSEINLDSVKNPNSNNKLLIGLGLGAGGALVIGAVVWLLTKDKTRVETKEKIK